MSTDDRESKQGLEYAKENFRSLFNIMPDPVVIIDDKGKVLDITDKALATFGYRKEELLGNNIFSTNIVAAKAKATMIANLAKRMLGIHIDPYITECITKNGQKIYFEINTTKIKYNGQTADLVIFHDVSERKKVQDTSEQAQARFRDIANSVGEWIWETDPNGKYTYSSPTIEQILGYKPEEVTGKHFTDFLAGSESNQKNVALKIFLNRKPFTYFPNQAICKNGSTVFLEKNAIPMSNGDGEFLGYRGVDRNVTERREMHQKLAKTERFAAVGEIAAMIAHDLRNPLQGIANSTYYLKGKLKNENDKTTKEVFQLLEEAVQHSNKIVNDLLEYSREIPLYFEEVTPLALVNGALSSIEVPKNIQIIRAVDIEGPIKVDADKIKRIFINLIKNSIDAMPNGGKLTIATKQAGPNIQFLFTDTGVGMTKETLDKLWTPLFTTKAKGMGFGLAICKRIVEAHSGKMSVCSTFGVGSTFTVTVPIRPESEGGVELWVNPQESLSSMTIKP